MVGHTNKQTDKHRLQLYYIAWSYHGFQNYPGWLKLGWLVNITLGPTLGIIINSKPLIQHWDP